MVEILECLHRLALVLTHRGHHVDPLDASWTTEPNVTTARTTALATSRIDDGGSKRKMDATNVRSSQNVEEDKKVLTIEGLAALEVERSDRQQSVLRLYGCIFPFLCTGYYSLAPALGHCWHRFTI